MDKEKNYENMKVRDLVTKLLELNQDDEIVFYSTEEGNPYKGNMIIERDVDFDDEEDFNKEKYLMWIDQSIRARAKTLTFNYITNPTKSQYDSRVKFSCEFFMSNFQPQMYVPDRPNFHPCQIFM